MSRVSHSGASWDEGYDLLTGTASASLLSPPMTKAELAAYKRELKAKDAKRKPVGFAAWPRDSEMPLGATVSRSKPMTGQGKGKTPPSSSQARRQ